MVVVLDDDERRRRKAERARRYRETHAEQMAETARKWRERNREHRRAYQTQWREKNLERFRELNRESMRRRAAKDRADAQRRVRAAERARARYYADVEAGRARARAYREAAKARDPEGYRAAQRRNNRKWREKHKDEINARVREKRLIDPEPRRAVERRYYDQNAEKRRARRRENYRRNRERERATNRRWNARERRRIAVGLPVRRLHRLTPEQRRENSRAAEAFFSRPVTPALRELVEADLRTPPELIAAWERECQRMRAAQYALRHPETRAHVINRDQAEEERMDAIARAVNDRLRTTRRSAPAPTAYAPVTPTTSTKGLTL